MARIRKGLFKNADMLMLLYCIPKYGYADPSKTIPQAP